MKAKKEMKKGKCAKNMKEEKMEKKIGKKLVKMHTKKK